MEKIVVVTSSGKIVSHSKLSLVNHYKEGMNSCHLWKIRGP